MLLSSLQLAKATCYASFIAVGVNNYAS